MPVRCRYGAGTVPVRCRYAAAAALPRMRADRASGCVYWLLAAIYLLVALGSALASGHAGELPVELAVSAPALLTAGPVGAARLAQGVTTRAVDALCGESADWNDIVHAWTEGFEADMRADAAASGYGDRRSSNVRLGGARTLGQLAIVPPRLDGPVA